MAVWDFCLNYRTIFMKQICLMGRQIMWGIDGMELVHIVLDLKTTEEM